MELRKHVALYLAIVMGTAYYSFQVHTRQPDGGTGKTSVIAEIDGKLLDDLCLDVVKVTIQIKSLPASALGTVALHIPQRQWDAPLATELALCSVDGNSAHHWHDAVLYLTLVPIEQYRKSASTHLLIPFKIRAAKVIPFWE